MTVEAVSTPEVLSAVRAAVTHYGATREALIPILSEVNRALGYLPQEALAAVSGELHTPPSQVASVATFYSMLSTKPHGRHVIQFCENAPCHVMGGREVWKALLDETHLQPDETSADGKWTLVTTSCLGICSVGPVIVVDDDVHGNVEPRQVRDILARYE